MTRGILLRGGRVVDPSLGLDGVLDVRVRRGVVAELGTLSPEPGETVHDVDGLVVSPGLIDVHVHLREPGQESKETIATGTMAAAAGGFTTVFCMPNTQPPLDSVAMLEELRRRTDRDAVVNVRPIATISEGRSGRRAADYDALAAAGAVGFSDDGESTADSAIMREALEASKRLNVPVMVHCEDPSLVGGAMHEGEVSQKLGIRGIPAAAEEIIIERDLALAALTGGWLHVCHVSTDYGANVIAAAKCRGANVTSEAMPHHLTMTDDWIAGSRTLVNVCEPPGDQAAPGHADTKVNPPLRPREEARGLLDALKRGDVDLISTDHAPHARPEKTGKPFATAAFGLSGSELALPTMLALVRAGELALVDLVRLFSMTPARLWGLNAGTLRPGVPADIVVFDPDERWTPAVKALISRSENTPLAASTLQGRVKLTFLGGDERYRDK